MSFHQFRLKTAQATKNSSFLSHQLPPFLQKKEPHALCIGLLVRPFVSVFRVHSLASYIHRQNAMYFCRNLRFNYVVNETCFTMIPHWLLQCFRFASFIHAITIPISNNSSLSVFFKVSFLSVSPKKQHPNPRTASFFLS